MGAGDLAGAGGEEAGHHGPARGDGGGQQLVRRVDHTGGGQQRSAVGNKIIYKIRNLLNSQKQTSLSKQIGVEVKTRSKFDL